MGKAAGLEGSGVGRDSGPWSVSVLHIRGPTGPAFQGLTFRGERQERPQWELVVRVGKARGGGERSHRPYPEGPLGTRPAQEAHSLSGLSLAELWGL